MQKRFIIIPTILKICRAVAFISVAIKRNCAGLSTLELAHPIRTPSNDLRNLGERILTLQFIPVFCHLIAFALIEILPSK